MGATGGVPVSGSRTASVLAFLLLAVLASSDVANADISDVRLEVATDKFVYEPGEPVAIRIAFVNGGVDAVTLHFRTGCGTAFAVSSPTGRVVYEWLRHMRCLLILTELTLGPGETRADVFEWRQVDDEGVQVPWPADYVVHATSLSDEPVPKAETRIRIGTARMTMTVASDTREMMSFETAAVRVRLTDDTTGEGVTLAGISATSRAGGIFSEVAELGGGDYALRWEAPLVRVQTFAAIAVAANADGYEDARSGLVFLVDPNRTNPQDPTQLFMLVSSEKWVLQPGESTVVTVFVFTMEGFAVSGASLKVSIRGAIIQIVDGVRDRLNGVYTFTLTAGSVSGATGYSLQIDATKFGYALATLRIGFLIVP